ncbi:MAG: O-antigen ligase family protein [Bacteroidales bacterium]|nr:O-antigen ligase family protein [Bacteroidales bacterium]
MNVTSIARYFVLFVLFVFVHYCEGLPSFGGVSFAQLWKLPILFYFIFCLYKYDRKWFRFEKVSYLYSFENFFCPYVIEKPFTILIHASKQLPLVLVFNFFLIKFKNNKAVLEKILYTIPQYIALTSLLVLLGVVTPLKDFKSADVYIENMYYYAGLFGAVHGSSSYFGLSAIILLFGFRQKRFVTKGQKIYNIILIGILLVSLYKTYVRTGWLMFAVGFFMLVWDRQYVNLKNLYKYIFLFAMLILGFQILYSNSAELQARFSEKSRYSKDSSVNVDGSGRFTFWKVSVENYPKNNFYKLLFGKGEDEVKADIEKVTGMRVFSHNHYVDNLAQYGMLGFVLYIIYDIAIFFFIKKKGKGSPYQRLSYTCFVMYVIFCFFQTDMYFWFAVLFAASLVLMYLSSTEAVVEE